MSNFEGMTAERVARNDSIFRNANDRIAEAAAQHGVDGAVPFVCECADPTCREIVRLALDEYERVRAETRQIFTALGHDDGAEDERTEVVDRAARHQVVRKIGEAGEVAEQLAPNRQP
jgi:hypothetical protein